MNPDELKHIAVLHDLDDDSRTRLAVALEEKEYSDGQRLFSEGDTGDSMYFIVKGRVRIEKKAQATSTLHKTLAVLEAGDYFGEMALLEQKPRSASAVAAGDARILRLSKSAFDQIQHENRIASMSVLFAMIRTSGERIRRLSTHVVVYDEIGKAIGEARDLRSLLDVILSQLSSATFADWGMLLLRSQFSNHFEVRSQSNLALTSTQLEAVTSGQGFIKLVLQDTQDRLAANFHEEEPFKSCARLGFETASLLLSPIAPEGQLLGLIVLGGQEPSQFDLNALNLVRGVARQAAQAILNARHREEQEAKARHSRQFVRF
jgi:CRP-like cAMP-binding protein